MSVRGIHAPDFDTHKGLARGAWLSLLSGALLTWGMCQAAAAEAIYGPPEEAPVAAAVLQAPLPALDASKTVPAKAPVEAALVPLAPRGVVATVPAKPAPRAAAAHKPSSPAAVARGYRGGRPAVRLQASRALIGQFGNRVGQLSWPARGYFSSGFGVRGGSFHSGMDICNAVGTPVRAAKAGTVVVASWNGAYGQAVDIDHGGGVTTRYGHCSRLLVRPGQPVKAGDVIALMGSTGRSTAPHVHFEVRIGGRAVNPHDFL